MYESNCFSHVSAKYSSLMVGLFFLLLAIKTIVAPDDTIIFNGVEQEWQAIFSLLFLIPSFICLLIFNYFGKRVVRMSADENRLEFLHNGNLRAYKWTDVTTIKKLWYTAPLMYSIRFSNDKRHFFFTTCLFTIYVLFFTFDLSKMGNLVRRKTLWLENRQE